MEVIEDNYTVPDWKDRITCLGCRSVLLVSTEDIKYVEDYYEAWYYIKCPLCDRTNYTPHIPDSVKQQARERKRNGR